MGLFERFLTLWVFLCIGAGVALGHFFPEQIQAIGRLEFAKVNIPVAILIWLMIVPMLLRVDLAALRKVGRFYRGAGVTLFVNWLVKPFSMAFLGWFFVSNLFRGWLPPDQLDSYRAGLILLAAAPCTAMVFVWSNLSRGEPTFTLAQVALNDFIMIFAFGPIVGLLLGLSSIVVPWDTLLFSVAIFIVVPLAISQGWRAVQIRSKGDLSLQSTIRVLNRLSLLALLTTLVLLFAFQGEMIVSQPLVIALLAVPILIQVLFNAGLAYVLNRGLGSPHCVAGPSCLIGASNFFELAVATAISLFGFRSGAALATVVGVLIEVPAMLAVVRMVKATQGWYEKKASVPTYEECCPGAVSR